MEDEQLPLDKKKKCVRCSKDKMFWGNMSRGIETHRVHKVSRILEIEFRRKAGEGERTWAREGRSCRPN